MRIEHPLDVKNYELNEEVNEGSYADDDLDDESILGYDNNIINVGDTVECMSSDYPTISPITSYEVVTINKQVGKIAIIDDLGLYAWGNVSHFKLA